MIHFDLFYLINNEWQLQNVDNTDIRQVTYPVTVGEKFDESTDMSTIIVIDDKNTAYDGYVNAKFVMSQVGKPDFTRYYLACDECPKQYTYMKPIKYKHFMVFQEPSKLLTRVFPLGKAFTQPRNGIGCLVDEVIDTLLATAPLRAQGEPQTFKLDENIRQKLRLVKPMEFAWDDRTNLFECLRDIGVCVNGKVKVIPNADGKTFGTVTYMFYNEDFGECAEIPQNDYSVDLSTNSLGECYTMSADNIVPSNISYAPSANGAVSCRYDGLKTQDENAYIPIGVPIYKINNIWIDGLVCEKVVNGNSVGEVPIKPIVINNNISPNNLFIVETARFETMTKEQKSTAFVYTIGDDKITNISNLYPKIFDPVTIVWKRIVDKAIMYQELYDKNTGEPIYSKLIREYNLDNLSFRVEYVSMPQHTIINTKKNNANIFGSIPQQQLVSSASSERLGLYMWNTSQRIGNTVYKFCADYRELENLPRIGQRYVHDGDNCVITSCTYAIIDCDTVRVLIEMSKDYVKADENFALRKKYRQFAIPQDTLNRTIHKDIVVDFGITPTTCRLAKFANIATQITEIVANEQYTPYSILITRATAFNPLPDVASDSNVTLQCPTTVLNFSHSVMLKTQMRDNMTLGRFRNNLNKLNYDAFYCKADGTIDNLTIMIEDNNFVNGSDTFSKDLLPLLLSYNETNAKFIDTFHVDKDSAEILAIELQLHFMSKNLIIGSGVADRFVEIKPKVSVNNALCDDYQVRSLSKPINIFTTNVSGISSPISGAKVSSNNNSVSNTHFIELSGLPQNGNGWAITDTNGNVIIAENVELSTIGGSRNIYVNVHY